MSQLNYHHLHYFYVIAREGSIVKAAESLHLTPQTISGQIKVFEDYLGIKLFDRIGKRLILNEAGKLALGYAEDIFSLGSEMQQSLSAEHLEQQFVFTVGVTDVIPKIFSFDLLKTCFDMNDKLRLICREGDMDSLLADMALNKIDLILSDRPLTPSAHLRAYNHLLGESGLTFYSDERSAHDLMSGFPHSLDQQPFLICGDKSTQKVNLMSWFDQLQINPRIVAEFDDSALMKFFGQSAYGIFCTPTIIERHVMKQYDVSVIGRTQDIGDRFYAISPERKIKHPGVKHLVDTAKGIFEQAGSIESVED